MTTEEILKILSEHFKETPLELIPGAKNAVSGVTTGDPSILVPVSSLLEICQTLKVTNQFSFDCLSDLTAVDRKDRLEVVYHLFSYKHKGSIVLRVTLPREGAHLPTVEGLWPIANWYEREVFDLFGIVFDGHGDLRRIMLPDDWVGYPLRKDYKEEADYHGISTTRPPLIP